jgi:hypothetical protein
VSHLARAEASPWAAVGRGVASVLRIERARAHALPGCEFAAVVEQHRYLATRRRRMTGADAIAAAMVVMSLALVGYAVVSQIEARRRKKRK